MRQTLGSQAFFISANVKGCPDQRGERQREVWRQINREAWDREMQRVREEWLRQRRQQ